MRFQCYVCNKLIRSLPFYEAHLGTHTQERPFKCNICKSDKKSYSKNNTLVQHYQARHPRFHNALVAKRKKSIKISKQKQPTCFFCAKTFKYPSTRDYHLATHTREYMFKCEYFPCYKRFKNHSDRQYHMDTFCPFISTDLKSKRTQSCYFCGNNFATKITLFYHLCHPTLEKPVKCPKCPKHMSLHTGKKHFYCKYCPKSFRVAVPHHIHNLKHECTPDFYLAQSFLSKIKNRCYFCQRPFSKPNELIVHMKHHTNEDSYQCKRCGKTVYSKFSGLRNCSTHKGQI